MIAMDEATKCEIYRVCWNAFEDKLTKAAVAVVYQRLDEAGEQREPFEVVWARFREFRSFPDLKTHQAMCELKVLTVDELYGDASSRYRDGDDIDVLAADAVTRMTIPRMDGLATFAINPPTVLQ